MSGDALGGSMQAIAAESGRAMGSASKSAGSSEDGGLNELYKVNQVWYRLPPTLSLVAKRTLIMNNALNMKYGNTVGSGGSAFGNTISFIFNTGEYYVSMPTSYMYMEIGYNSPNPLFFDESVAAGGQYNLAKALISQGNAMSMFDEVSFTSASGTEICREQNKGLESAFRYRYEHTQEYIDTIGQLQGAARGSYSKNYDGVGPVFTNSIGGQPYFDSEIALSTIGGNDALVLPRSGRSETYFGTKCHNVNNTNSKITPQYTTVCIPLDQVIGCFKPYMQTLFPAGSLAGGKLDLRLRDPLEAFQFIAGAQENTEYATPTADPINLHLSNLIAAAQSGFVINKIYLVMDSFQLQDNVLKRLNQVSAGQDGLSVLFDTYDATVSNFTGYGTFEAQVQQARSRIVRSYCVVRDDSNTRNPFVNSLASEAAITRVCQSCPAGYLSPPTLPITSGNKTGIGGSLIIPTMFMFNGLTGGVPSNLTGGTGWNSLIGQTTLTPNSAGSVLSTLIGPLVYPWIQRPALPSQPLGFPVTEAMAATTSAVFSSSMPIVSSYQAQLGALYFPQQPLTTPGEYYENALYLWGKCVPDKCDTCSVSYEDFLGGLGWALYDPTTGDAKGNLAPKQTWPPNTIDPDAKSVTTPNTTSQYNGYYNNPTGNSMYGSWIAPYGMAIYGMLAEKSQALQLSGLPISNARLLRHKFTFSQAPLSQKTRRIDTFTQFTRVMKVFLGGRVVVRE